MVLLAQAEVVEAQIEDPAQQLTTAVMVAQVS
jgi:hypothetical protein